MITKWNYAANGIDLLTVKQQNGANDETLVTFTYNAADPPRAPRARAPRTVTDAKSQVKTLSYFLDGNLQGMAYNNNSTDPILKKARLFNENPLAPGIRVGRVGAR